MYNRHHVQIFLIYLPFEFLEEIYDAEFDHCYDFTPKVMLDEFDSFYLKFPRWYPSFIKQINQKDQEFPQQNQSVHPDNQ
jgi:hypothetical protein